jgi:hypothetical protein
MAANDLICRFFGCCKQPHPGGKAVKVSLYTAIPLLLFTQIACRAEADLEAIKAEALACNNALKSGDFETLADKTYPKVVELMGGKAKMVEEMKKLTENWKKQGIQILSNDVEAPKEVIGDGADRAAILPTKMVIKTAANTVTSPGFLLGISADSGKTWTFVDGSQAAQNRQLLPKALQEIKLPEIEQAKVEENKKEE